MQTSATAPAVSSPFTGYQKFVIAILAFLQFTIILDFIMISPMGAIMMPILGISPAQFGVVVSAYAFSAGASGFIASGFADRFDRKRFLIFFYVGFIVGTFLCGIANSYAFLLFARMVTGLFGGVIGSITLAIATDLFALEKRGRVMGVIQTAFGASQILGVPAGLFLANHFGWHAPFLMLVGVAALVGVAIVQGLQPIKLHLVGGKKAEAPLRHMLATVSKPRYIQAFTTTALLATGGFMLMPFGSAFSVHNLGLSLDQLPTLYLSSGLCAIVTGPLVGRASDRVGKFKMFAFGSLLSIVMVLIYTRLGVTPFAVVVLISAIMFVGISSRMIPSQTLMSAIPTAESRGAFMAVNASVQQVSGGLAAMLAGVIVVEGPGGHLEHFDTLGYVVAGSAIITLAQMFVISRKIEREGALASQPVVVTALAE